ncbi:NarL family two-component system sensor histidine kinase LiaS [Bacillus pakistanensis]|uniref:histidine kinase n=1 Tax=Rossellomorea pakistanensis TaxID=992288 RepID=A0ABS2NF06_9BACI|nr:sensor histidine kinase [Bacillus pakistanensis]MBM7586440.1 NarL family two-component system sensor histidine kinase LiaS [Bacillus pakistanensis]
MKSSNTIRAWFIKSYLMTGVMGTLLIFLVLQGYLIISDTPQLNLLGTIYLTLVIFIIFIMVSVYSALRSSSTLTSRLDDVSAFVSTLRRGKFSERVHQSEQDEIGILSEELNQLAGYIQDQVRSLQRLADEKSELAQQAHHAAVMEERHRLARDLHDSVSQQLFALNMLSSAALRSLQQPKKDEAESIMSQVAEIAAKAQGEMRALLLHLRPVDLKGETLAQALNTLVLELKDKTSICIDAHFDDLNSLSKGAEAHLFRIIQEALSNVLRHAEATKIKVETKQLKGSLTIYISDNGNGFNVDQYKLTSYGLQTMRERCEEIGGIFEIRSKKNKGTYIHMTIPTE